MFEKFYESLNQNNRIILRTKLKSSAVLQNFQSLRENNFLLILPLVN